MFIFKGDETLLKSRFQSGGDFNLDLRYSTLIPPVCGQHINPQFIGHYRPADQKISGEDWPSGIQSGEIFITNKSEEIQIIYDVSP